MDISVVSGVQRRDQPRVVEAGGGVHLPGEAENGLGRGLVARQHLHGHDAARLGVDGFEDMPHSSLADRIDDSITAERELRAAIMQLFDLPSRSASPILTN